RLRPGPGWRHAAVCRARPCSWSAALRGRPRPRDDGLELRLVGACPVDPAAAVAAHELPLRRRDLRRHLRRGLLRAHGPQRAVALHAAGERAKPVREVERADDLLELLQRIGRAQPVAVRDPSVAQDSAVAGQDDAPLADRQVDDGAIVEVVAPQRVEADEAQVSGQRAEMHVEHEARDPERLRPQARDGRDVDPLEDGIHRDALAAEEPAEAFAAAVLAVDLGDKRAMDRILTAAIQTPDLMAGVASALGWLPPDRVRPWIAAMIEARPAASRRLGIAACAVHREDPGPVLARLVRDPDGGVRARALRAVGELKRRDLLPALRDAFDDADDDARFWAVWSAVLLGDRSASERLRAYAQLATPFAGRAIQLAPRTMHPGDARDWLKRMAQHAETRRLALIGCGVVGDPVYVPVLISQMSVPELARVAGEEFSMITGVDLAYED